MTVLATAIDPRTPAYLESRSAMLERLVELEAALEAARAGGGEKWVTRHHARGKLLPRERVEMLLDQDSPFLELSPVAAWGSEFPVGASVVTGIGVVEGVECVVIANDPTVDGGAVNPYTVEKIRRAARIASVNRLPLVNLVESTGAAAPAGPPPGGAIARDLSQLTADRVPTVCVVFGATTGDAAYLPALSDYTIMVRGHAKMLTIHPQPVRVAGANGRPAPEVRSTPTVPAGVTGPADQLAEDERDGLRLARQCVRRFNWRKRGPAPRHCMPNPPKYDAEDLLTMAERRPGDGVRAARGARPDPGRQRLRRVQADAGHGAGDRLGRAARLPDRRARQPGRGVLARPRPRRPCTSSSWPTPPRPRCCSCSTRARRPPRRTRPPTYGTVPRWCTPSRSRRCRT
nr:hypothetical protein GCM10020092_005820 [Actinoplanes digitatis]